MDKVVIIIIKFLYYAPRSQITECIVVHLGSLTTLLRSQWGPLSDESTICRYTGQILRGLKFLVSCGISCILLLVQVVQDKIFSSWYVVIPDMLICMACFPGLPQIYMLVEKSTTASVVAAGKVIVWQMRMRMSVELWCIEPSLSVDQLEPD